MVTPAAVLAAVRTVAHARRKVERFRCGQGAFGAVLAMEPPWVTYGFSNAERSVTLAGLAVVVEWLPENVWRLTDGDDTLLYDCREGRTP